MKIRNKKLTAIMMAGTLGVFILGGVSSAEDTEHKETSQSEVQQEIGNAAEEKDSSTEDDGTVGKFETTDLDGETYTEKIFEDYDLTMVNVFATWCSPCVWEIPDLASLQKEMVDEGVNVVGFVMDAVDEKGNVDEAVIEKAKELRERAQVEYPFLIPDAGYLNGRLSNLLAYPETFFVDKDGKIVGGTYSGSSDLEGWKKVIEQELANLKGE